MQIKRWRQLAWLEIELAVDLYFAEDWSLAVVLRRDCFPIIPTLTAYSLAHILYLEFIHSILTIVLDP